MDATRSCVVAALLFTTACAHQAPPATSGAAGAPAERVAKNPNIISREELQDPTIAGRDAEFAIRQLRPAFFRTRGPLTMRAGDPATAPGTVHISQDFGPLQLLSALSGVDTRSLIEIRYLDAVEATARFGINANGGPVIVLLSSKQ